MRVSRILTPPGGWQYRQGKINLVAETFDLLVKNVKAHRVNNGIAQGDIETDIEDQIIAVHPELYKTEVRA